METSKPTVTLKFSEISGMDFAQALAKIANAPTDNRIACQVRRIVKEVEKAREAIRKKYREDIMEIYGKKGDDGKLLPSSDGNPNGFDFDESRQDEFLKAQEEFGHNPIVIQATPLSPRELQDVKLSARELDALKDLFVDEEPKQHLQSV